jgi:hypothetical protein
MTLLKRLMIGFCSATIMALLSFTISEAGTPRQSQQPEDCLECHYTVVTMWENSRHGHATTAVAFLEAWQEQGQPSECLRCHTTGYDASTGTYDDEGIACAVCHATDVTNHPEQIMPTDTSAQLCGTCHIDTLAELEESGHGESDLPCARCHNAHSNELKAGSVQETCQTCHTKESHMFTDTLHAQEGLPCTGCHLRVSDSPLGEGHGKRQHTFTVDLNTCTACHSEEMHYPAPAEGVNIEPGANGGESLSQVSGRRLDVSITPTPTSPYNFTVMAAIIGLAFGLVGSPWLERWYRQRRQA